MDVLGPGGLALGNGNHSENFLIQVGAGGGAIMQGGARFLIGKPFTTQPPAPSNRGEFLLYGESTSRTMEIVYAPEPSTWLLAILACAGLLTIHRRGVKPLSATRSIKPLGYNV